MSRRIMSRIIICIILALSTLSLKAQELVQGNFISLLDTHIITVQFNFSQADIDGLSIEEFIEFKTFEKGLDYSHEFNEDKRAIIGDFIEEFNDTNSPIILTVSSNTNIVLIVNVNRISRKGNMVNCNYVFYNKANDEIIASVSMTSKEGRIGSFTNLMGDAFEKAGKRLGKYIKKMLRAERKKQK